MKAVRGSDARLLLWLGGSVLLLIVLVSILAPKATDQDPKPTTYNNGSAGAKAALLLLTELGYKAGRWDSPEEQLQSVDAPQTTLILAEPYVDPKLVKATAAALQSFLERGGRVLITGGPVLLPDEHVKAPNTLHDGLCDTTPEGQGPLAGAGEVSTYAASVWNESEPRPGPLLHVEQRCGEDAVVVRYAVGKGEVVWWSSSQPLSNAGLHDDGSLRLLLASVGEPGRTVLFDEFVHGQRVGFWDAARGLPLKWLVWQFVLIAGLLILSFSRRKGPLRMPVTVPRTSPIEFAESMGHLYQRAGTTNAATGMARRRLLRFLQTDGGISRSNIDQGPAVVAEALRERFGGDWSGLRQHLADSLAAETTELAPRSALRLVQALASDVERLHAILTPQRPSLAPRETVSKERNEKIEEQSAELASATRE